MNTVGRNIPHDSARGHVTGESIYIDDMPPLKGELIVDFLWSPVAHGRIRSLNIDPARKIEGVVAVFTYRDLHRNLFGPVIADEILLAEDKVTFIGQPVAIIAAENRDAIKAAKKAIEFDIEELEPVFTIDEAKKRRDFIGPIRHINRGNADRALAEAEHVIEGVWINGGQDHFYLESQAAMAVPGELDTLTVHSSTQNPSEVQHVIAHLLGLHINQVTVITKRMGGAFGGKECQATHPAAIAAIVALKTKRPARLVYTKDDDMCVTGGRHPFQNDYKVGFTRDGVITAMKVDIFSDGGAYADLSTAVMARAMTHVDNAYWIPNIDITGTVCRTNYPPNTAFRGFGGPQGVITIENVMEEIATVLGIDAFDVRRRNVYGSDVAPPPAARDIRSAAGGVVATSSSRNVTPYGEIVDNNTLPRLFDEIAERADYRNRVAAVRDHNAKSKTELRGISCTAVKFGISFNTKFLNQANALVNIFLDGSIQVSTGATEMGQGVNTKIKQIVADEFGIDPDLVIVMPTSTEKNNNTSATAASSGADLNGSAAADACRKIRARLVEVAAQETARRAGDIEASPTSIVFEDGLIYDTRRSELRIIWKDLLNLAYARRISLGERGFYATQGIDWNAEKGSGVPFLYYTKGVAVSEVSIDRFTGHMTALRSDLLMDIGKSINPGIDRGQITGAFIQGMGWLTNEELRWDSKGNLLSHSPTTYKIPNIGDVPRIFNVDWIDAENPLNIRSSKAVGEPPLLLAISVFMAIKNALGGAKINAPATGEEILMRMTAYTRKNEPAIAASG
jgi:xanthine dehydrogenase large subunit